MKLRIFSILCVLNDSNRVHGGLGFATLCPSLKCFFRAVRPFVGREVV